MASTSYDFEADFKASNPELDQNPTRLIHVKNMHTTPNPESLPKPIFEEIAFSQFNLAKYILEYKKHKEPIILLEGLAEDLSLINMSITNSELALFLFRDGLIPDDFSLLNDLQKKFLVQHGGVHTLFYLNQITEIHKSITPEEQKEIKDALQYAEPAKMYSKIFSSDGSVKPEFKKLINDKRDLAAIRHAKEVGMETGCDEILIVFGGAHRFENQIRLLNDPTIVYGGSVETRSLQSILASQLQSGQREMPDRKQIETWLEQNKISPEVMLQLAATTIACCMAFLVSQHIKQTSTFQQRASPSE